MFRIGLLDYSQNPLLIHILNHNKFVYAFSLEVNNFILITIYAYFDVLFTVHLSIFISVFSQLDAQNLFHIKFYFIASTCFEHMCSSSGGKNCIKQPLV